MKLGLMLGYSGRDLRIPIEQVQLGFGKLLDQIINTGMPPGDSQMRFEPVVGDRLDAGRAHGTHIQSGPIRLAVGDDGFDALSVGRVEESVLKLASSLAAFPR